MKAVYRLEGKETPSLAGGNVSTDVILLGSKRSEMPTSIDNCAAFWNLIRRVVMNNHTYSKTHPEGLLCARSGHYEPGMLACNLKLSVGGVLIGLYLRLDTYDWQNLSMH